MLTCQQTLLKLKILLRNRSLVLKWPCLAMNESATTLVDAKASDYQRCLDHVPIHGHGREDKGGGQMTNARL
jgi:hypothetical protein